MLVMSRKPQEEIWIGDSVVKVVSIQGNRVRLGVDADPSLGVRRPEILTEEEREEFRAHVEQIRNRRRRLADAVR